jgi:EAL domain-containing protein (putative c-di-GMP-specific phosphodiesterase class I)
LNCWHSPAVAAVSTPVFVLHACSQEYLWTRGQHQEFVQVLGVDTSRAYSLNVEYLDTKRASYNARHVDLIGEHLLQKDLSMRLMNLFAEIGVSSDWITLELTESSIMESESVGLDILTALREIGVSISIDDFGTGHSSLNRLKLLPISELKIDRSFVRDIADDKDDAAFVQAILALSSSLDLKVIAEGVEHVGQEIFLLQNGCLRAQGYHYARPMPEREFLPLLIAGHSFPLA